MIGIKKIKKKLNGMTLVEVIVALAVFTIISALLASSVAFVCNLVRKTNKLNRKVSNEAPIADLQKVSNVDATDSMVISINGNSYTVPYDQYVATEPTDSGEGGNFKYIKPQ